jgi:hypothetical protein
MSIRHPAPVGAAAVATWLDDFRRPPEGASPSDRRSVELVDEESRQRPRSQRSIATPSLSQLENDHLDELLHGAEVVAVAGVERQARSGGGRCDEQVDRTGAPCFPS